jgi:hypothetical protein
VREWTRGGSAAGLLLVDGTQYTVGPRLELVHRIIGSALFAGQLLYSVWVVRTRRTTVDAALVGVQLLAGVTCFLYFVIGVMGVMLVGQLAFQAAVLGVIYRELLRLDVRVGAAPAVLR